MNSQKHRENEYDLILIGSGMGALTVASLMAQMRGKKILVLERHFKAGGFTHDFKRKKFHWDVGLHYVGFQDRERGVFDLITRGGVHWMRMPEPFEHIVFPEFTFKVYGTKERFITDLIEKFPQEESAIRQYFRDLQKAALGYTYYVMRKSRRLSLKLIGFMGGLFNPSQLNLTTKIYLDRHFKSQEIKAILTAQWGTYGLPPSKSSFPVHAMVSGSFLEGGYYPAGGAGTIAASVKSIIEEKGGQFLLNREVTQILIENGRAVGVKVRKVNAKDEETFEEYYAPTIVSDTGAASTYLKLIPQDYPIAFRESLRQFVEQHSPTTNIALYLGLSQDPRQLGFQGENHWIYSELDHDDIYNQRGEWIKEGTPIQAYLSFPSLKDPRAQAHTAEILVWADYDFFAQWREQPWLHRDEDYQALKERLADAIVSYVDRHYPGFADIVEYKELSTPVTNEHFTGHGKGGIYGLPCTPERFQQGDSTWTRPKTPLPGLYLTGADVFTPGIMGALFGGIFTLSDLPDGISYPEVYGAAAKAKKHHPPSLLQQPLVSSNHSTN